MTKEEIKALISAKIAGQGNQVDSGGALDEILNAIVDAIPEGGGGANVIEVPSITMNEEEMTADITGHQSSEFVVGTVVTDGTRSFMIIAQNGTDYRLGASVGDGWGSVMTVNFES